MHLPKRSSAARRRLTKHSRSSITSRRASAPSARCRATSLHRSRSSSRRRGNSATRMPRASCAALRASAASCAARRASSRSARCCANSSRRPSNCPRRCCSSPPRRLRADRASGAIEAKSARVPLEVSDAPAASGSSPARGWPRQSSAGLLARGVVAAVDAGPLALDGVNAGCASQSASHSLGISVACNGPAASTSPHASCCAASSRRLGSEPQSFLPCSEARVFELALSNGVRFKVRASAGVVHRATFGQSSRRSAVMSRWRCWRNCV
mmetsp:Transcript_57222/g.183886  ORF Transcript_57222/g.183886 Transcript_57222/m.183886 type:complete len:269 (+) Transcript_57222:1015-1821(+)